MSNDLYISFGTWDKRFIQYNDSFLNSKPKYNCIYILFFDSYDNKIKISKFIKHFRINKLFYKLVLISNIDSPQFFSLSDI